MADRLVTGLRGGHVSRNRCSRSGLRCGNGRRGRFCSGNGRSGRHRWSGRNWWRNRRGCHGGNWTGQFSPTFCGGSGLSGLSRCRFGNGHDVVVLRGEESFPRPQLFAGQRHAAAGGTAGGVVVDRAHSCSPLVEESGSLPEAARSVGALLGFSDCAGACTRRPTSVPLAFCMSIAC